MPPTASEAAKILRQHFGFAADPTDPDRGVGDPTGAVQLGINRGRQADELDDRIANDAFMAAMPAEGFEPGSPGKRYVSRLPAANLLSDTIRRDQLRREDAADPFTGAAETARIGNIQNTLDTAATTLRPEVDAASRTLAERNAFAAFLKERGVKLGDYEAAASPAAFDAAMVPQRVAASDVAQANAKRALTLPIDVANDPWAQRLKDLDLERQGKAKMQPSLVPGMFPANAGGGEAEPAAGDTAAWESTGTITDPRTGIAYTMPPNLKPLGAADQAAVKALGVASPMLGELKSMLDPTKDQIPNAITARGKWALYQMGVSPDLLMNHDDPKEQARYQLASMVKIIAGSPYLNGSRNFNFIKQIQQHLTNPVATDKFLYNQINELEQRWPEIQHEIIQRHINPSAPLNFNDPWTPPTDEEKRGQIRVQGIER